MASILDKRTGRRGLQLLAGVLLFLSVVVLSDRYLRGAQLDLTEDKLYTLSDGTKEALQALEEPVRFDLYVSKELMAPYPILLSYAKRVEDMLQAFKRAAPSKVVVSVIDPEPFSEAEDEAVARGLEGVPLSDGSTLYLGLSVRDMLDGSDAIPFFATEREAYLEYDLIKLVTQLDDSAKARVGVLTSLPMAFGPGGPQAMMQGQSQPYVIYQQLREQFDVAMINEGFETLPSRLDVLLIAHPPLLTDDQLYQIDQYALSGGRVVAFIDPHAEAQNPRAATPMSSGLGGVLSAWGLDMAEGKIIGDQGHAQRISTGGYGSDSITSYMLWHAVPNDAIDDSDVVTGPIETLNLASVGALSIREDATTAVTPLIRTSRQTMLYDSARALGKADTNAIARDFVASGEQHIILARISGPAKSAYGERAAAEDGILEGDIQVVVGSDADLFDDRFWVRIVNLLGQQIPQPIAGNGALVLGLVEHMAGSEALLLLRPRGVTTRPFTVVEDIRRRAEARYLAEEQVLTQELEAAEARLAQLEGERSGDGSQALFSPEQEAEIDRFRVQMVETRRALREVKRGLRADIDHLGSLLAGLNIAAVPALILLVAFVRSWRHRRRRSGL